MCFDKRWSLCNIFPLNCEITSRPSLLLKKKKKKKIRAIVIVVVE